MKLAELGRNRAAIIASVVGVIVIALVVLFAVSPTTDDTTASQDSPLEGKLAPALKGTTTAGAAFDLDKHRGKWVLVNFFATWCPPCVAEQPELVKFSEATAGQAEVVSVAFDDTTDKVTKFFADSGANWPVLAAETGSAALDYGVVKLPESYLIDPSGTVVKKLIGGVTAAEVQKVMSESGTSGSGAGT